MRDFFFSWIFLAYVIGFNCGVLAGMILAAFRRTDEGVGQGLAATRNERAVVLAGPGGDR